MFFKYDKKKKKNLEEYKVVKGDELFIPPHQWIEMVENFDKEDIIAYLSTKVEGLPFPHTRYTQQEKKSDWNKIKSEQQVILEAEWSMPRCTLDEPHTYKGRYLYFDPTNNGLKVSNQFTESIRVGVVHKQYNSPLAQWTREGFKSKRRVIFRPYWGMIDASDGVNSKTLKRAIEVSCYKATQFKPSLAKALYNFFGAKKVLDPSSGWGDRLVGFLASDAESYIGIDPNTKLHEPHQQIVDFCKTDKETKFICSPSEEADLSDVKADFIFTSPPYFDIERYSKEDTQSSVRYPKLNDWLEGYLYSTLENCWGALEEGGRIAINISDTIRDNIIICQPMLDYMESLGAIYEGVIGHRISKRRGLNLNRANSCVSVFCEPIFIWSKGEAPEPKWNQDNFFNV
tara:strand:- start:399 stop:1598 length:1200 start_codon:yes stop_codon:yes gene_type:complete